MTPVPVGQQHTRSQVRPPCPAPAMLGHLRGRLRGAGTGSQMCQCPDVPWRGRKGVIGVLRDSHGPQVRMLRALCPRTGGTWAAGGGISGG